jgi:hypothetical protein
MLFLKYIFDKFRNVKKNESKNSHVHFTCYMSTKSFHDKSSVVWRVKEKKIGAKNKAFHMTFFFNFFILKYIFDKLRNVKKKMNQKIRTYIFTCYMPTKSFHDKSSIVWRVNEKKFGAKNKAFHTIFFSFYIDHRKYRFSAKLYKRT